MPLNEQKTLIFVVSFLSIFFLLVNTMPAYFVQSSSSYPSSSIPEYFDTTEIMSYADYKQYNLTHSGYSWQGDLGGHLIFLSGDPNDPVHGEYTIVIMHASWKFLVFTGGWHTMEWINTNGISRGIGLTISELMEDYNENATLKYTVKCSHFKMFAYIGFNTTLYSNPQEALENDNLTVILAISIDEVSTKVNAFELIASLLSFRMPEVHPFINAIIAIPIWIAIIWLVITIITKFIPFTG